jgi:glucoamylase
VHLPRGKSLAIEDRVPFTLHLGFDGWQRVEDRRAERTVFGLWSVVLSREELEQARELNFTRRYEDHWENFDHRVELDTRAVAVLPHVRIRDDGVVHRRPRHEASALRRTAGAD